MIPIKQNMGRNTTGFPAYHHHISKIIVKAPTLKPVHMWITLGCSYFTLSETILLHLGAYLGSQAVYFVVVICLTLLCSHLYCQSLGERVKGARNSINSVRGIIDELLPGNVKSCVTKT